MARALAAIKGAMRGAHGEEAVQSKISSYFLMLEISEVHAGMMIALPPEEWTDFQEMSAAQLAKQLLHWAKNANLKKYPKSPRGPKKPKAKRPNAQFKHVSTAKLLAAERAQKAKQAAKQRKRAKVASP